MSKYYKTRRAVLMAVGVTEWKGLSMTFLRSASTVDKSYQPFTLETEFTGSLRERFEDATEEEWLAGLAIAEKRQAELDKKAAIFREGEKYGIPVKRNRHSYRRSDNITGDFIVRCTKTRWVGLKGSYKRGARSRYGDGTMLDSNRFIDSPSIYLASDALEELAERAAGRPVVNFVKEAKKAEAGK